LLKKKEEFLQKERLDIIFEHFIYRILHGEQAWPDPGMVPGRGYEKTNFYTFFFK